MTLNKSSPLGECAALITLAKARMDRGFSRVGRGFKAGDQRARAASLLAARSISMANAVAVLALRDHANEALPILRSLLATVGALRAVAEAEDAESVAKFWEKSRGLSWEVFWSGPGLEKRLRDIEFGDILLEENAQACRRHFLANAGGLPWSHAFGPEEQSPMPPDRLLRLCAVILGHALGFLELIWPGNFEGALEILERAGLEKQADKKTDER
ncbi:MAG: hypothetical protein ACYCPQ_10945 [Elusimicrobiota bacterium]